MGLRDRIKRLQRKARGGMIAIPQRDGTTRRFPEVELKAAFLEDLDRTLGRVDPDTPVHPLVTAIANSSDHTWTRSFFAGGEGRLEAVEDLSEGP